MGISSSSNQGSEVSALACINEYIFIWAKSTFSLGKLGNGTWFEIPVFSCLYLVSFEVP